MLVHGGSRFCRGLSVPAPSILPASQRSFSHKLVILQGTLHICGYRCWVAGIQGRPMFHDSNHYKHLSTCGSHWLAHMQVLSLEASLSAVHSERSQSDIGLKSHMQELLSELQSTLQVHLLKSYLLNPYLLCNLRLAWLSCISAYCLEGLSCHLLRTQHHRHPSVNQSLGDLSISVHNVRCGDQCVQHLHGSRYRQGSSCCFRDW